jgi:GrpB-like predicted nucleotidyltransferase (UPF0157 family)
MKNKKKYERFFLKKRGPLNFNLALVLYAGSVWYDNIMLRDYLRAHPEHVKTYARVKQQAIDEGHTKTIAYADYKRDFVETLKENLRASLLPPMR